MGKPDVKETKKRERNAVRTEIGEESIASSSARCEENIRILKSLQPCQLKDNIDLLNNHIENIKNAELLCHLKGLKPVLMMFMAQVPVEKEKKITKFFDI